MDVNSISTSAAGAYAALGKVNAKTGGTESPEKAPETAQEAAVFEPSQKTYTPNAEVVERLKAEVEQRMQNLVQTMLGKQIKIYGDAGNIWEALRTGQFTVDPEVQEQAQKDIADDGYWGVEQTSDRIVQYATALTGGDPDKLDSMIEAFEQGFAEAEKEWGGTLPDISQKTREAVHQKFQKLKEQYAANDP